MSLPSRSAPPDWSKVKPGVRTPSKGWGPRRVEWYSFCSKLHGLEPERRAACPACNAGTWINVNAHRADGLVWKHARPLALWWHNRPRSRSRRLIERHFPGLRNGT